MFKYLVTVDINFYNDYFFLCIWGHISKKWYFQNPIRTSTPLGKDFPSLSAAPQASAHTSAGSASTWPTRLAAPPWEGPHHPTCLSSTQKRVCSKVRMYFVVWLIVFKLKLKLRIAAPKFSFIRLRKCHWWKATKLAGLKPGNIYKNSGNSTL